MNQDNYASLEASKRLVDMGLAMKRNAKWLVNFMDGRGK